MAREGARWWGASKDVLAFIAVQADGIGRLVRSQRGWRGRAIWRASLMHATAGILIACAGPGESFPGNVGAWRGSQRSAIDHPLVRRTMYATCLGLPGASSSAYARDGSYSRSDRRLSMTTCMMYRRRTQKDGWRGMCWIYTRFALASIADSTPLVLDLTRPAYLTLQAAHSPTSKRHSPASRVEAAEGRTGLKGTREGRKRRHARVGSSAAASGPSLISHDREGRKCTPASLDLPSAAPPSQHIPPSPRRKPSRSTPRGGLRRPGGKATGSLLGPRQPVQHGRHPALHLAGRRP